MFTPVTFYGNSYYSSFNEAYGLAKTTKNIPLHEISNVNVGPLWNKFLSKWSKNTVKIVLGDLEKGFKVVGTGAFIKENKLITCAHALDFFHDTFTLLTSSGFQIEVPFSSGIINKKQDWAIFNITSPEPDLFFPPIALSNDHTNQYAMIHHGNKSFEPLVAIGNVDPSSYYSYKPCIEIDGGPSSSGAVLLNERGELAMMHISRKKEFSYLRYQLSLQDILAEEERIRKSSSAKIHLNSTETISFTQDEELEHGYLDYKIELSDNVVSFNNNVFEQAKELIFSIINESQIDFYTKAFGSSRTIYGTDSKDAKMKSLRVDVQKPCKEFANIQIQFQDQSLAGLLLSKELANYGHRPTDIKGIVNFCLGKLINLLKVTQESGKVYMVKVMPKEIINEKKY